MAAGDVEKNGRPPPHKQETLPGTIAAVLLPAANILRIIDGESHGETEVTLMTAI